MATTITAPSRDKDTRLMHELEKLLKQPTSVPVGNETLRKLQFYRMAVELEQLKEPAVKDWYNMPWQVGKDGALIVRYADNKDFVDVCVEDRQNKYPKDVCVGLFMKNGDKEHPLFLCVHAYADIEDDDPTDPKSVLFCPLSDFAVNPAAAGDMELEDTQVEELNGVLQDGTLTLDGLRAKLAELLGEGVSVVETLRVSLSSRNPSLSRLVSELRMLGGNPGLAGNVFFQILDEPALGRVVEALDGIPAGHSVSLDEVGPIDGVDAIHVVAVDDAEQMVE